MKPPASTATRYDAKALREFAQALLDRAGVRVDIARDVAAVLLDGDLLGHTTHGLALLGLYLEELEHDRMAKHGAPEVLNRRAAAELWDGRRLPGPWLTLRALERGETSIVVPRRFRAVAFLYALLPGLIGRALARIKLAAVPGVGG